MKEQNQVTPEPHFESTVLQSPPTDKSQESSNQPSAVPFLDWYQSRWLSSLRWFFQVPIWIVYGFAWIPMWYIATGTPSGGVRTKWLSLSLPGKAIACLPLLLIPHLMGGQLNGTIHGPNGEEVLLSENGRFHYYLDAGGEKVLHGKCLTNVYGGDGRTTKRESEYDAGVLVQRTVRNSAGEIIETMKRQEDGNYLWADVEGFASGVQIHRQSIVQYTNADNRENRKTIQKLDAVLLIHDQEVDQPPEYVDGFLNGLKTAIQHGDAVENAKQYGAAQYSTALEIIQRDASKTIARYRRIANEQMAVGNDASEMNGLADGLTHGYSSFGISLD